MNENQLQKIPAQTVDRPAGISIEQAFQAASSKSLDKDSLEVMKQLLAMDAEQKFNRAFVAMQAELPVIVATSVIPNRGKYERYEDILHKVGPIMARHGFSVSFAQSADELRITVTCKLMHIGGHSQSNSFAVRSSGRADSECQADCKASTTAKRNAFCQALNIVIAQDAYQDEENDATLLGNPDAFVTPEQSDELCRRVNDLGDSIDLKAFWKFAQANRFDQIPASKYNEIDKLLQKKEQAGK